MEKSKNTLSKAWSLPNLTKPEQEAWDKALEVKISGGLKVKGIKVNQNAWDREIERLRGYIKTTSSAPKTQEELKTLAQNTINTKVWYTNGSSYSFKTAQAIALNKDKSGYKTVVIWYSKELPSEMLPGGVELEYSEDVLHKVTIPRDLISWIDYEDEKGYAIEINNKVLDK